MKEKEVTHLKQQLHREKQRVAILRRKNFEKTRRHINLQAYSKKIKNTKNKLTLKFERQLEKSKDTYKKWK